MKTCQVCGESKPESEYYKHPHTKDHLDKRCKSCVKLAKKTEYRLRKNDEIRVSERPTKCICPNCGAIHEMKLFWTGRGTPRKHCVNCLYVQGYDAQIGLRPGLGCMALEAM